jgi:hypothetical protein
VAALAVLSLGAPAHALPACAGDPPSCVRAVDRFGELDVVANEPPVVTTNDYPPVRDTTFIAVPFGGVTSRSGGVIAMEHVLRHPDVAGGSYYLPCKAAPTTLPNMESPFGGEPYKAACENPTNPSYFRSGGFGGGIAKKPAVFAGGIRLDNSSQTDDCLTRCVHNWANRASVIAVEIYLKKAKDNRLVTDFDCVRPRFHVSGFSRSHLGGLVSRNYGTVRPLCAYERGASRLQGYVYSQGRQHLEGNGRLVFSVFQNDATGRTSTGQPLQAFSSFQSAGGYYTTGVLYAGYYKLKIRDTLTGKCVVKQHTQIKLMSERADIHLDRPAFGIKGAREVAC